MHFYNAESCKELIIIIIKEGPTAFFFRIVSVMSFVLPSILWPIAMGVTMT